jgi:hypothetical protein
MQTRTFRIARLRSAAGSFAEDILKRYGLTKDALVKRFATGELINEFSLLFKNLSRLPDSEDPLLEHLSNTLYDLSIDKAVNELARNAEGAAYTMEVLKTRLKRLRKSNTVRKYCLTL